MRDWVTSVKLGQYHGCWCPGSLCHQNISSHDIDYVEYVGPSPSWGSELSTCVKSMWRNDIKCKHIFMFLQKSLAREGLRGVDRIQRASASNPVIFIQTRRVADSAVICHVISRSLAGWEWVAFSSCHMDRSCLNQSPDREIRQTISRKILKFPNKVHTTPLTAIPGWALKLPAPSGRAAYCYRFFDIDTSTDTIFRYRYQFDPYCDIHITILSRVRLFCTEKWTTAIKSTTHSLLQLPVQ